MKLGMVPERAVWDSHIGNEGMHCNSAQHRACKEKSRSVFIVSDYYHSRPGLTMLGLISNKANNDNSNILNPFCCLKYDY